MCRDSFRWIYSIIDFSYSSFYEYVANNIVREDLMSRPGFEPKTSWIPWNFSTIMRFRLKPLNCMEFKMSEVKISDQAKLFS